MPMTFDEFMEAYEQQGGPLPSAWSDEAIAEAQNKANMMSNAVVAPNRKLGYRSIGELKNRVQLEQDNKIKPYIGDKRVEGKDYLLKELAKENMIDSIFKSDQSPSTYIETKSGKKIRISNHGAPPSSWDYKKPYTDINPVDYQLQNESLSLKNYPDFVTNSVDDFINLEKFLKSRGNK